MKIINFGSLNVDYVYKVSNFVRPGETLQAASLSLFVGGKGLNQSIALARAGASVIHAGLIGQDGVELKAALEQEGVDVRFVQTVAGPSGHAIIQVNTSGENSILTLGGANHAFSADYIDEVLSNAKIGDVVLLQNEITEIPRIMRQAKAKGLNVVFNAAPCTEHVNTYPLECVDLFIINELEGRALTGESMPEAILKAMQQRFPKAAVVLTLGEKGACYFDNQHHFTVPSPRVNPKDSTGAGDTFTGYFLATRQEGLPIQTCLSIACRAASICVTRDGAAVSIPKLKEVLPAEELSNISVSA